MADDGSTDGSQAVIQAWTERYRGLFAKIDLLFQAENRGICQTYVNAQRRVEGERFVKVDGDDLLAPYNIFELTELLSDYDIICTGFLKFHTSDNLVKTYRTYLEVVLQAFIRGKTLRQAVKLGCPVMGTAIYRKSLLTEDVYHFILQFRTIHDRACFQKILTGDQALKSCYVNRPIILYRVSERSISNFNSPSRRLHSEEIGRLCRVQREKESSPLLRLLLLLQEKSIAFRASSNRLVRLLRFFSPYFTLMLWLCIAHWPAIRKMERELVDRHWRECEAHCQRLTVDDKKK